MAAPVVNLADKRNFDVDTVIEAAAGESQIIINFPRSVPDGKKAQIRLRIRARVVDA